MQTIKPVNRREVENQIRNLSKKAYPLLERLREIEIRKQDCQIYSPRWIRYNQDAEEIERSISDLDNEIQSLRGLLKGSR